ncbi:DUF6153 family protein [Streptomyces rubellomurinus]|uniref:DUF6153 family protein n=1 Tax=Streptomyces rubellomurinus (strain ATCC 31215) TaxID=359131 RepID=UPI0005F130B3|nr:DUF6153 family protein [Streptomyces rubellomurinus]
MARSPRPFGPSIPWVPRLLLLAALVLGIVTMHTLGHPSGGHGGHDGHGRPVQSAAGASHHAMADSMPVAVEQSAAFGSADPGTADGMDPMAVCLAVLAGWTLVLLVAGPLLRRSGDAATEVRARLLRAVRALPPPGGGRLLLTRLSVLRQ